MNCIEHSFNDLINDFNSFTFFYPVFDLREQRGKIGTRGSIIFEIRTKEQGHNTPHLHAHYENKNISISLIDFFVLAGNIPPKQESIAIEWTKQNIDVLKSKESIPNFV